MNDNDFVPTHNRTPLLEARHRQCRFIVSADLKDAMCCGEPTTSDLSSWCIHHSRLVYEPRVARDGKRRIAA